MISLDKISKTFDNRQVLNCPSLQFEAGLVHGVIGLNGAGKTTFFNILSGFLLPDRGAVFNNDRLLPRREVAYLKR